MIVARDYLESFRYKKPGNRMITMTSKKWVGAFIVAFLLLSTATFAKSELWAPLLPAVVNSAFERYPDRALPTAINHQGQAIRQQASSLLANNPSLAFRHENDDLTDNFGFRDWAGSVQLPLWLPGQRSRRLDVADATDQEAASLTRFYKWRVSGEVRELLWSYKIADAEVILARAAVDSARALETDIDKRVQAGELAVTDHILARKETLVREITLSTATANLDELRQQYRMLTGLSEVPKDILEKSVEDTSLPNQHPTLLAARYRTDRAQAESNQARHEKRANPILALGARNERAESGQPFDTILTLELNLPLGLRSQSAPKIADAERQLAEQQISHASLRRELEKQLVTAISEKQRTARTLKLAQQQQQLATEGLRLTQRAFDLGESDLFTLLQARTQALTSERALQMRQLEQGRAVARHNQALGVIPE